MAASWGTQVLNIYYGTFRPVYVLENGITEIEILPSPTNPAPKTILQQGGRSRKRIKFDAYVTALSEYDTLATDYLSATVKTFSDEETGILFSSIIKGLSEPEFVKANLIKYSLELIEA